MDVQRRLFFPEREGHLVVAPVGVRADLSAWLARTRTTNTDKPPALLYAGGVGSLRPSVVLFPCLVDSACYMFGIFRSPLFSFCVFCRVGVRALCF